MSTDPHHRRSTRALDWRSHPDLAAVCGYAVLATVVLALGRGLPPAVRIPIALPLVAFVPGYAAVTALFPTSRAVARDGQGRGVGGISAGLSPIERLTLATVASVALVPMVALVANAVAGVRLVPVLVGVVALTLGTAAVAASRRPEGPNAADPHGTGGPAAGPSTSGRSDAGGGLLAAAIPRDAVTLAAVVIAAALLTTSAAIALTGPGGGDPATEFYLVDDVEDGEFAAGEYPRTLERGESRAFALGIEHDADDPRDYTVVAVLERVDRGENETRVLSTTELRRTTRTVDPGGPSVAEYRVEPGSTGEDLRVAFHLYRGEAPEYPDRASAHRVVSLPVEVTAGDG